MSSASAQAPLPEEPRDSRDFLSSDMAALATHMDDCKRSHGRFFSARSAGDVLRNLVSSRIVSTGALVGAVALGVLLAFA
jgi:ABC-type glycerol-3-phosphate transport system permease component